MSTQEKQLAKDSSLPSEKSTVESVPKGGSNPEKSSIMMSEVSEIVDFFIYNYYTLMTSNPEKLHCFYNPTSTMTFGVEGSKNTKENIGPEEIQNQILSLDLVSSQITITSLDYQLSLEDRIVVFVFGDIKKGNDQKSFTKFAQFFFLARQGAVYYVLNDCLHYFNIPECKGGDHTHQQGTINVPLDNKPLKVAQVHSSTQSDTHLEGNATSSVGSSMLDSLKSSSVKSISHSPQPLDEVMSKSSPASSDDSMSSNLSTIERSFQSIEVSSPMNAKNNNSISDNTADVKLSAPTPITSSSSILQHHSDKGKHSHPSRSSNSPFSSSHDAKKYGSHKTQSWASLAATKPESVVNEDASKSSSSSPSKVDIVPESTSVAASVSSKIRSSGSTKNISTSTPGQVKNSSNLEQESQSTRSVYGSGSADPDLSVFIRGVSGKLTIDELKPLLEQYGPITYMDIVPEKQCAFVNYASSKDAKRSIGCTIKINDMSLFIEERKFRLFFNMKNFDKDKEAPPSDDGFQYISRDRRRGGSYNYRGNRKSIPVRDISSN